MQDFVCILEAIDEKLKISFLRGEVRGKQEVTKWVDGLATRPLCAQNWAS